MSTSTKIFTTIPGFQQHGCEVGKVGSDLEQIELGLIPRYVITDAAKWNADNVPIHTQKLKFIKNRVAAMHSLGC